MDKVHIVWAGSYSDKHIVKIFNSHQKAEEYCNMKNNIKGEYSDEHYVSSYDMDDDNMSITKCTVIEMDYTFKDKDFNYSINEEIKEEVEEYTMAYQWGISINRVIDDSLNIKDEIERLKKVIFDKIKEVTYIKEVLGILDMNEINKML